MSDLITCIVPVYNGERYLTQALDSIYTVDDDPSVAGRSP